MKEQIEKQAIEELTASLWKNTLIHTEDLCHDVAETVIKDGYRKQIKAEWKSGRKNGQYGYYCTNCDARFTGENAEWIAKEHDFCPKCGARMKGGAE